MEDKAFIKLLTDECNNSNYFIILRYQKRKTVAINFDGDEFAYYYDNDEGIGMQSISNKDRIVFCHTDLIDYCHLRHLIKMTSQFSNNDLSSLYISGIYEYYHNKQISTIKNINCQSNINIDLYKQQVIEENKYARRIIQNQDISTYFLLGYEEWKIFDSNGSSVRYNYLFSSLRHKINFEKNKKYYNFQISMSGKSAEVLTDINKNELFKIRTKNKAKKINYIKQNYMNDNSYNNSLEEVSKIILDHELISILVHEIVGHAAEDDMSSINSMMYENNKLAINKTIGSSCLNLVDTPECQSWGYQPYDSDGNKRSEVEIIKSGIIREGLHSLYQHNTLNNSNFSDRLERYSDIPLPRMTNLTLRIDRKIYKDSELDDLDIYALKELLIKKSYILDNEAILFLLGGIGGKVNIKDNSCTILPEFCFILENDNLKVLPQMNIKVSIEQVLESIIVGIGTFNNDNYNYCRKKEQIINVSGGSDMYVLFSKFDIEFSN